jgi:PAS domain S-box-containing protein
VQALAVALCFFGGKIGLWFGRDHLIACAIWPPAGLALGCVLIFGYRLWPGLLLGAFLLKLNILAETRLNAFGLVSAALCMSSGDTLQALVGAWLVETYAKGRDALRQPRTVALFFGVSAVVSPVLTATLGSFSALLAGLLQLADLGDLWASLWLGNMLGVVLLTPLLLAWSAGRARKLSLERVAEALSLLLLLLAGFGIAFGPSHAGRFRGVAFCCMLIATLLWTAFRFGARGTVTANLVFGFLALAGTLRGHGPFVVGDNHTSVLLAQNFIAGFALMSLLLAAEVKQRQRIDDGLRASEQRYRDLFEYNPQPMWVFDYESLRFLAVNQAAVKHYGYSRDEFLSMTVCDIRPVEDVPPLLDLLKEARRGLPVTRHHRHRKKDGTIIDVEIGRYNLVMDGREAAMILITDITERKQAEERAAAFSELGHRLSAASTPQEATRIIIETADRLFGWTACRLELGPVRSGLMEIVYGVETINGRRSEIPAALAKASQLTTRALEQGGQLVPSDSAGLFVTRQPGVAAEAVGTIMAVPVRKEQRVLGALSLESQPARPYTPQDLQSFQALADHCGGALERIRAETALRESDQRLHLALAASRMGIWTIELQGRPRFISSPELDAIFGLKPGEFEGSEQTLFAFIHPEDHHMVRATMARAIKAEGEYELEFRILPRDRPIGWLLARGCSCFDARGKPSRLIGVAFDITARKLSENEVLRLNLELEHRVAERTAALEAINKELESFSYSVSHDLRAPLRSIRGFSEVLLDRYGGKLDDRGREFLRRACESSNQMDLLIDDLLNLSRIGRTELHHQPVDLSALANSIADQLRAEEPKRAVKFSITAGLQTGGDERLLRIALENLLRNAWKFTANQPKARIEFGETPGPQPAFFVRDNGVGFDMAYASRLFGVFQRLHSTAEFPGSGIGLATVQRILNRHGGRAWAESAVNQGATFYFSLPQPGAINSDHASFAEKGTSAIMSEQVTA